MLQQLKSHVYLLNYFKSNTCGTTIIQFKEFIATLMNNTMTQLRISLQD